MISVSSTPMVPLGALHNFLKIKKKYETSSVPLLMSIKYLKNLVPFHDKNTQQSRNRRKWLQYNKGHI